MGKKKHDIMGINKIQFPLVILKILILTSLTIGELRLKNDIIQYKKVYSLQYNLQKNCTVLIVFIYYFSTVLTVD